MSAWHLGERCAALVADAAGIAGDVGDEGERDVLVPVRLQDEDLSVLQTVLSVGLDGGYGRAVDLNGSVVLLMDATALLNATTTCGRSVGPLWDFDA